MKDVFITARTLIADPKNWIKGSLGRAPNGEHIALPQNLDEACCFCLEGAIHRACQIEDVHLDEVWRALVDTAKAMGVKDNTIFFWNDAPERTHDEVLALLDEVIHDAK